jgi:hypothetical protein
MNCLLISMIVILVSGYLIFPSRIVCCTFRTGASLSASVLGEDEIIHHGLIDQFTCPFVEPIFLLSVSTPITYYQFQPMQVAS